MNYVFNRKTIDELADMSLKKYKLKDYLLKIVNDCPDEALKKLLCNHLYYVESEIKALEKEIRSRQNNYYQTNVFDYLSK